MAQKDKVKELVGRGLHSYHTKSLQQMDRIEKKNKEQNHKISILSNELDNDYLTKTEEGSVISLEHSKEGMVYLDELQGNTLVNYCTDGSKELTLNGDIDVEGTFVTTTEGVDNGKVDVMCEGDTLVNLLPSETIKNEQKDNENFIVTDAWLQLAIWDKTPIKANATYTLIVDIIEKPSNVSIRQQNNSAYIGIATSTTDNLSLGRNIITITTSQCDRVDNMAHNYLGFLCQGFEEGQRVVVSKEMVLLEGDWTNKKIPPYFEGMKSVGQDDENGHKIEILSNNQNQFRKDLVQNLHNGSSWINENSFRTSVNYQGWSGFNYYLDRKKKYWLTYKVNSSITEGEPNTSRVAWYDSKGVLQQWRNSNNTNERVGGIITDAEKIHFGVISIPNTTNELEILDIQITEIETNTYQPTKYNKKEILINEPLRKANDFYRDRLVKIGNKCYIERNTKEVVLDGTHNVAISGTSVKDETLCRFDFTINGLIKGSNGGEDKKFICDKLPYLFIHTLAGGSTNVAQECISNHSTNENSLNMVIKKSRLETIDVTGVNKWLSNNNIKIIIPIATPIYEPLEIEPTLNTYNDTTHIYNNSIIPCNMKIQNSGYNAIIKPSTLYTIALDTNKSGTIGMNLGGVKGTTTNNVLTLSTPATLTDDSLRLYGKGIKGSKVRLLEGDKTNWIPSFFEGMKSSFEDKFDTTDNTYKMEILNNNKNLMELYDKPTFRRGTDNSKVKRVDDTIIINGLVNNGWEGVIFGHSKLLKKNTSYAVTITKNKAINVGHGIRIVYLNKNVEIHGSTYLWNGGNTTTYKGEFKTINEDFDEVTFEYMLTWDGNLITQEYNNLILSDIGINDIYTLNKSNKIQFLINEPLRSVPNGKKDKFVFRDGKLMIERNTKSVLFNGSEDWRYRETNSNGYCYTLNIPDLKKYGTNSCKQGYVDRFYMKDLLPFGAFFEYLNGRDICLQLPLALGGDNANVIKDWLNVNNVKVVYEIEEPVYEEIPFELQKIILEGYENGTLFFDTNIPPTSTVAYAGETPIVKSVKLNKTEVLNNTNDINDNIIPYLMDMDYRVVMLQLATEELEGGVSMARLFGGTYEMIKRDILSKRLSRQEYGYRLADYFNAGKLTEEQVRELEELR